MGIVYALDRSNWTPTVVADGAQATGNGIEGYFAHAAPAIARIIEVFEQGATTSSTYNEMAVRRHSTAVATPTAKTPAQPNPSSQAVAGTWYQTATTMPTISNGTHVLNCDLNTYGGVVRWVAGQGTGVEIYLIGGSTGNNDISLGSVAGTPGAMSSHIGVEEL